MDDRRQPAIRRFYALARERLLEKLAAARIPGEKGCQSGLVGHLPAHAGLGESGFIGGVAAGGLGHGREGGFNRC